MKPIWQAPRAGLLWLLMTLVAIVTNLVSVLPLWVTFAVCVVLLWRIQIYRGAWNYPGRTVKLALVSLCIAGILISFRQIGGLEPLTALLVSAFALKLLEMHQRRDALILVFVGYFLAAVLLLFEQTIGQAFYTFGCLLLVTTSLVGLHQSDVLGVWSPLRRSTALLAQSLPLMLVLFMVMPRLGAFWSVPFSRQVGQTGVSGEMAPGELSKLGKNGAVAFRVTFDNNTPEPSRLYWRGPVLTHFDGRTWRQSKPWAYDDGPYVQWYNSPPAKWRLGILYSGEPLSYSIVMEPTQQPWLFALAAPQPGSPGVGLTRELRLIYHEPIRRKIQYRVRSWPEYAYFPDKLHRWQWRQALQLPEGFNPKALALAQQWREQSADDITYIRRVLAWYNKEFVYTLEPPLLGKHSVDEFLWRSQRGFCSHFAGSFVFLMRAAGIPARVVTGYQGGEHHPSGNYLLVYQYNAHAWAEVWLPGSGWVRFDPTAAVAPERIESGFEATFGEQQAFLADTPFGLARVRGINWLNNIRLRLDAINYYWATWVLGYENVQASFLARLLGGLDPWRVALFILVVGGVVFASVAVTLLRGNLGGKKSDAVDNSFARLCRKLEKVGMPRKVGEGPHSYRVRLEKSDNRSAQNAIALLALYEKIRYADEHYLSERFHLAVKKFQNK